MPAWTVRTTSPAGLYLPEYMTTGSGGWNAAITGNTAVAGADVMNNCVGTSIGRLVEMHNSVSPGSITSAATNPYNIFAAWDAQFWYGVAVGAGYSVGAAPAEGAVGVYSNSDDSLGHVVNIEEYSGGVWYITEGHYYYPNPPGNGSWDFSSLDSNYMPQFLSGDPNWRLIGFIYPSFAPAPPGNPIYGQNRYRRRRASRFY